MRRLTLFLALCVLLTPSLASAQTAPVVMGYRTATGAAQAVAALTPLPVTAAALSTLTTMLAAPAAAIPPLAALVGMSDGTLLRALRARDLDTGAGTDYWQGVGLMLEGTGGGTPASAGAGAVDAGTQRTTLAADDPAVVSLGTLDDTVYSNGGAIGAGKGQLISAFDTASTTVKYLYSYNQSLNSNLAYINGNAVAANAGNSSTGTIRVVQAAIASGASDHVDVDASEVAVLAAKAGRRFARIQVYSDVDGGVCCALGATTNACADGILLDASPAAGKAGGSAEWEGYGGAITCRAAGAWTATVAVEEW